MLIFSLNFQQAKRNRPKGANRKNERANFSGNSIGFCIEIIQVNVNIEARRFIDTVLWSRVNFCFANTSGTVSELSIWQNYIERSLDSSGWWIGKLQCSGFAYNIRKCRMSRRQWSSDFITTRENVFFVVTRIEGNIRFRLEKYCHETMGRTLLFR